MGNARSWHNHHHHPRDQDLLEMPFRVRELHYAVMVNDQPAVQSLLADGVNINFPWFNPSNPSVKDGSTPLIIAVSLNYVEIVQVLLHSGAYINKCDRSGCTPIYKAAFHGRPALIEVLIRAGADVNLADFMGKTPLYICVNNAIVHSCTSAVRKLIKAGAIVDKPDKAMGVVPIHLAARWKRQEILELLISAGSDVNIVDLKGRTPLYLCVRTLSTKLYREDLRHQIPIILTLFRANADMLNLIEWLLFKGPGMSPQLLVDAPDFRRWYASQITQPQTLMNMCRKVIQKTITRRQDRYEKPGVGLREMCQKLPLPTKLQKVISRKMFYREEHLPQVSLIQGCI